MISQETVAKIEENQQLINKIVDEGMKKHNHYTNKIFDTASLELISKNKHDNIEKIQLYTKNQVKLINSLLSNINSNNIVEILDYIGRKNSQEKEICY